MTDDGPTDRWTDGFTTLKRCENASKKKERKKERKKEIMKERKKK